MIDISASEATHITSNPRSGKLGTLNKDDDDDDDDVIIFITHIGSLFWCPYMNPQIFSFGTTGNQIHSLKIRIPFSLVNVINKKVRGYKVVTSQMSHNATLPITVTKALHKPHSKSEQTPSFCENTNKIFNSL